MNENVSSNLKISLTNGFLCAAILFIIGVLYYVFGVNYFNIGFAIFNLLLSFAIIIIFMVIGMRSYRDKYLNGKISYAQKLIIGLVISLIAVLISGFLNYSFFELIDPDYMKGQLEDFIVTMEERGFPTEDLEKMSLEMTPFEQWFKGLKYLPIVAVVLSLIIAAFVKSDTATDKFPA
jgi:type IV secretory pathway TrbD component